MIGDAIAYAIVGTMVACIVVTAAVTTALIYGLPVLWSWVKPYLHLLTA